MTEGRTTCGAFRRFPLGRLVATPGALQLMRWLAMEPFGLLIRHQAGDWGDLSDDDKRHNELALVHGERLLSSYTVRHGDETMRLWVITEADRSVTTILLPEEY